MTVPATPPTTAIPPSAATTPPTGGGDTPPVATDPPGTEAPPATPPADEWANFDAERAKQTILRQRKSEADAKAALAEANKRIADFERAKLTDAERVQADLERAKLTDAERVQADLEQAQRERDEVIRAASELAQRQAFDAAAMAAGVNPKALAAARTIAAEFASTDASGTMTVDDALFGSLRAEHEYLFITQQAAPPQMTFGSAAGQGPSGKPTTLTPEQVAMAHRAGIPPEEFAQAAARVKR